MWTGTPPQAASAKHIAIRDRHRCRWCLAQRTIAGGVIAIQSAPTSTLAPSLCNSVAIAAIRSVSFTRQEPTPVRRVVPPGKQGHYAAVMAASGISVQS